MKTLGLLWVGLLLSGCEDGEDAAGAVDASVVAAADSAPGGADASRVDGSPPPADAAPSTDADTEMLEDLVDEIVDDINEIYDIMCACSDVFCDEGTTPEISDAQKACMSDAVTSKAGTPGLAEDLDCTAVAIDDALTCVKLADCQEDEEDSPFQLCFDDVPDCMDSPHFAEDFELCLEDL